MVSTKHCCRGKCTNDSRYPEKLPKSLQEMLASGQKAFIPRGGWTAARKGSWSKFRFLPFDFKLSKRSELEWTPLTKNWLNAEFFNSSSLIYLYSGDFSHTFSITVS